ncbi:thioredoxin 1 [Angomonas deanei]|uniref:Thioredoxin, putative n=1 Tax=Angomonas deanei TaxID=59799 RepID=S9VAL5_9TRYP|nr:thioredoxin 1 [Angomonas deanei]EPY39281.1 thioredoxin 1 [Angomonas deanei]CAD2221178.1 Thioredoxin, putative [Angomonas deanei]|eukprot:EPY37863.1 thioredoxin 1 [Angomonas deanei]
MSFVDVYGVEQFREIVNSPGLTVVYFSAVWCGPCKTIEKDLGKLTYALPNVRFAKVDADNNPEIVTRSNVAQLPTFMLIRDGKMLGYVLGADIASLRQKISSVATPTEASSDKKK